MRIRKHLLTPLAAVTAGLLAGAVGTVCLDTIQYLRHRRAGGTESPLAWEFAPVDTWETAPDPGQAARHVIEGFTKRKLPDRWAGPISTAAHWAYGSAAAGMYGVMAGSARRPHPAYGLPFGATVWAAGYVVLPEAGLYQPIWKYDAKTLAWDLSAHLAYGAGTGTSQRRLSARTPGGYHRDAEGAEQHARGRQRGSAVAIAMHGGGVGQAGR